MTKGKRKSEAKPAVEHSPDCLWCHEARVEEYGQVCVTCLDRQMSELEERIWAVLAQVEVDHMPDPVARRRLADLVADRNHTLLRMPERMRAWWKKVMLKHPHHYADATSPLDTPMARLSLPPSYSAARGVVYRRGF